METVPDWSGLGSDMITEIAGRLQLVEDFAAFRGVCRSWRAAAGNIGFGSKSGSVPLLMTAEREESSDWKLYSISSKRKIYRKLTLPEAKPRRRGHAGFGWFIMKDKSGEAVTLFDPFSGANIILPFSDVSCCTILSANPSHASNFMLMKEVCGCLRVWRPGDSDWTSTQIIDKVKWGTPTPNEDHIRNYCYCNGKFHAIYNGGNVWILDPDRVAEDQRFITRLPEDAVGLQSYLVGSSDGRKLIYITKCEMRKYKYFKLYQFDVVKGEWQEISGLDQDAVFIGSYNTTSFCVRASPHIKPNCIYFTEGPHSYGDGRTEAGVYNIQDGSFEFFGVKSRCAVWIDCSNIFNTEKGNFEHFNAPRIEKWVDFADIFDD